MAIRFSWRRERMKEVAVSDLNQQELERFAQLLSQPGK